MEQSTIKRCPFCGGNGELCECYGFDSKKTYYLVQCMKCDARTVIKETPEQVKELWNRRVVANEG